MLRYQSGRTVGYVLLGSIAGELGATLRWFDGTRVVLPLLAASLLGAMGMRARCAALQFDRPRQVAAYDAVLREVASRC